MSCRCIFIPYVCVCARRVCVCVFMCSLHKERTVYAADLCRLCVCKHVQFSAGRRTRKLGFVMGIGSVVGNGPTYTQLSVTQAYIS